jgi:hypothetical protein
MYGRVDCTVDKHVYSTMNCMHVGLEFNNWGYNIILSAKYQ